jgi:hypothetical protein
MHATYVVAMGLERKKKRTTSRGARYIAREAPRSLLERKRKENVARFKAWLGCTTGGLRWMGCDKYLHVPLDDLGDRNVFLSRYLSQSEALVELFAGLQIPIVWHDG